LSKYEFGVACYSTLAILLIFRLWVARCPRQFLREMATLLPGLFLALAVYGWLVLSYGLEFLVQANWVTMPGSYFMREYGLHFVKRAGEFESQKIASAAAAGAISLSLLAGLALLARRRDWIRFLGPGAAVFLVLKIAGRGAASDSNPGFLAFYQFFNQATTQAVYPSGMFLVVAAFCVVQAIKLRKFRSEPPPARRVASMALPILALLMSFKIFAGVQVQSYSIFYAPLLFVAFLVVVWECVQGAMRNAKTASRERAIALLFAVHGCLLVSVTGYAYRGLPGYWIHTARGDVRISASRAAIVPGMLRLAEQARSRGSSILVLPEYAGIYFLAGMEAPSRFYVLTPGILSPGKYTESFLQDVERRRPLWVLLSNRPTYEYGVPWFGLDYDREVLAWVERNYAVEGEIGRFERRETAPEGVLVYRRKSSPPD
jgi:hypothetical protein